MSFEVVTSDIALGELLAVLCDAPAFALDTEGNSFHAYRDRVCLLQFAVASTDPVLPRIFLVDPMSVDPRSLKPAFADPKRCIVLHGGDYDVRSLRRDFDFDFGRLFDTMIAAQTLHLKELGLAALLRNEFGIAIAKGEQRSDWGRRPLRAEQLVYGAEDVRHLLPLWTRLNEKLIDAGRLKAAEAQFEKLRHLKARQKPFDPGGWRRLKGARELGESQQRILEVLWVGRDRLCREMDRAPFKLIGEPAMVEVARRNPRDLKQLREIPGVGDLVVRRLGAEILSAAERLPT